MPAFDDVEVGTELPTQSFPSVIDLVKNAINEYEEDFPPPATHHAPEHEPHHDSHH